MYSVNNIKVTGMYSKIINYLWIKLAFSIKEIKIVNCFKELKSNSLYSTVHKIADKCRSKYLASIRRNHLKMIRYAIP